jgi:hypothetical protein
VTPAQAIARARRVLARRAEHPPTHRLRALDLAGEDLAASRGPRAYTLALKVIELAGIEAAHNAARLDAERRSRRAKAAGRARAAAYAGVDVPAIRAWANTQGLDVPQTGRYLPPAVLAAYRATHPTAPAEPAPPAALAEPAPRRRRRTQNRDQP